MAGLGEIGRRLSHGSRRLLLGARASGCVWHWDGSRNVAWLLGWKRMAAVEAFGRVLHLGSVRRELGTEQDRCVWPGRRQCAVAWLVEWKPVEWLYVDWRLLRLGARCLLVGSGTARRLRHRR